MGGGREEEQQKAEAAEARPGLSAHPLRARVHVPAGVSLTAAASSHGLHDARPRTSLGFVLSTRPLELHPLAEMTLAGLQRSLAYRESIECGLPSATRSTRRP